MPDESNHAQYYANVLAAYASLVSGEINDALKAAEDLLKSDPEQPATYYLLGLYALKSGDHGRAIQLVNKAHEIDTECREFADVLAVLHTVIGHLADGLYFAKLATALESNPMIGRMVPSDLSNYFQALSRVQLSTQYINGMMEYNQRNFQSSINRCELELRINKNHHPCMALMGKCYYQLGHYGKAVDALQAALRLAPNEADYHLEIGDAFYQLGQFEDATVYHERALSLNAESVEFATRAMAAAEFLDNGGAKRRTFRKALDKRLAAAPKAGTTKLAARAGGERIRIGYLSNAYYNCEAGAFIVALFNHIDHARFEIAGYQQSIARDTLNTELTNRTDSWRHVYDLNDEVMGIIVAGDEIDALVDLCGYSRDNRAGLIAARPAPVQVGWLEYPYGLGVAGVDYVLGDPVTAKTDKKMLAKGQRLIVLEYGLLALPPLVFLPDVGVLPAVANGHVTFGGRCDLARLNPRVAATWSEILHKVPGSRLLLGNVPVVSDAVRDRALEMFRDLGIADRLAFWKSTDESRAEPEFFHDIDIFLDAFPVSGRLNLCEALWMGVPVLSVKGGRRIGQIGASILMAAGCPQWICETPAEMVAKAVKMAGDIDALAESRRTLRDALRQSALFRPDVFVPAFERALVAAMRSEDAAEGRKRPRRNQAAKGRKPAKRRVAAKAAGKAGRKGKDKAKTKSRRRPKPRAPSPRARKAAARSKRRGK